jgi:hypothetical protein
MLTAVEAVAAAIQNMAGLMVGGAAGVATGRPVIIRWGWTGRGRSQVIIWLALME